MSHTRIKLVHVTSSVSRLAGGLLDCVRLLSKSLLQHESVSQEVFGLEDEKTLQDQQSWNPVEVRSFRVLGPSNIGYSPRMFSELCGRNPDVVHLHGLWKYPAIATNSWFRKLHRPYIVSPQGMLEPWALKRSRMKKRLAMMLFQKSCLKNAACIHATAHMEAENIRRAGFINPIALIPNGVEVPEKRKVESGKRKAESKTALFLSRIHPKKGLLNLVKAWSVVSKEQGARSKEQEWVLVIAGPDEGGHLAEVQAAVRSAGLENRIHFQGEVMGDEKIKCYQEADLFILPSFSENFGLVIAEALSCGVPVVTTRATPWEELETHRCGWWIETGAEPLMKALRAAMALSDAERIEMGLREDN